MSYFVVFLPEFASRSIRYFGIEYAVCPNQTWCRGAIRGALSKLGRITWLTFLL